MIDNLTPEHEALIRVVRDEWINFCLGGDTSIDKTKASEGIAWIYNKANLQKPKFIAFAEGPLSAQIIASIFPKVCESIVVDFSRQSVGESVWQSVGESVRQSVGRSVEQSVGESVWQSVGESVWQSVGESVWQPVRQSVGESVWQPVRQSVGESVGQSVRQSVEQSVGESVRQSVGESVWQSVGESVWQPVRQSVGESVGQSVRQSVEQSVGESVRQSVGESVWQSVGESVWQSVGESVWQSVGRSVEQSVGESVRQSVGESVAKYEYPYDGLGWDAGYYAFYEFFERLGVSTPDNKKLTDIFKTGIWDALWFKDLCVVTCRPSIVKKNKAGQLHNETGAACEWPSGEKYWFLNGINVPDWLVMTDAGKIDPKLALTEKNVDVQREIIRKVGAERMLKACNAKTLDVFVDSHSKGGNEYKLMEMKVGDSINRKYLYFEHASLRGVFYAQPVHPDLKKALHARAWMLGHEINQLTKMRDDEIKRSLPLEVA